MEDLPEICPACYSLGKPCAPDCSRSEMTPDEELSAILELHAWGQALCRVGLIDSAAILRGEILGVDEESGSDPQ